MYQYEDFFIDLLVGARWLSVEAEELGFKGEEDFFLPAIGFRFDRLRDVSSLWGFARFERNIPSVAGTSDDEGSLFLLGRGDIDDDYMLARWSGGLAFYLEPLLWPRSWRNLRTPSSSTLAHEIAFSTNGQYAFGTRVIPLPSTSARTKSPSAGITPERRIEWVTAPPDPFTPSRVRPSSSEPGSPYSSTKDPPSSLPTASYKSSEINGSANAGAAATNMTIRLGSKGARKRETEGARKRKRERGARKRERDARKRERKGRFMVVPRRSGQARAGGEWTGDRHGG